MIESKISIPTLLKVGNGVLDNLGEYITMGGMKNAVIYFGNGLIDMFGYKVMESLKEQGITVLEYRELDSTKIEDIIELACNCEYSISQIANALNTNTDIVGIKISNMNRSFI